MPLTPLSGVLGLKRAAHLLRRATFGASKQQIDRFAGLTAQQAISQLFATDLPDPPLPIDPATGQEWVETGTTDANSGDDDLRDYFKAWCIGQMMSTDISEGHELPYALREKITLFFHTHFTTMEEKVNDSRALYFQNQLFRIFSFDGIDREVVILNEDTGMMESLTVPTNFRELTKKLCVDNAMAATFSINDFKIQPVLEQLFQSAHFYEAVSGTAYDKFGGIIKSPLDLTLGVLKFFDVKLPSYTMDTENFYVMTGNLLSHMKQQGFNFYEPFEVAGYVAYHQYPVYNRNWISTNYLTQRYD